MKESKKDLLTDGNGSFSIRRFGWRRASRAVALLAVSALVALAVPTRSFAQAPTFNAFVSTYTNSSFNFPERAAVGDFNGDGKLDALVSDGYTSLRLMLGNGDGTFTEHDVSAPGAGQIKAADLNGDGKLDAVFVSPQGDLAPHVLLNTGNDVNGLPQFTATTYTPVYCGLRSVTVGDLNGDGSPDFIVGNCGGGIYTYLNNGHGIFTQTTQGLALQPGIGGPAVGPGVIADLNGDGKADYVVASNQNAATNVFFGNGDGTFQQTPVIIPSYGISLAVADVNHDGKPDLIEADTGSASSSSTKLMVFLNSGDGTFSAGPTLYPSGCIEPVSLTTADLNGDGNLDAVMSDFGGNGSGHQVAVLLGDGHGAFGTPSLYPVNQGPIDVSVRDFNGDGKLDIATVGRQDRTFGVLLNTTVFAPPGPAPINWVNWTGSETVGGVTKYVGKMVVPRTGGGSTTVNVKYTPPTQAPGCFGLPGICFLLYSTTQTDSWVADYFAQGSFGALGRNPARSPYTSSKVINIPDGGGAASDKNDIIALQYAGPNKLEFTDASTGLPVSIASPVFAYVSLNGNGYGFDQDFDILSFGDGTVRDIGYWGIGTSYKSTAVVGGATQYQLLGTGEPHGTLQFRGSFSTVNWQSLSNESWNGFTIGVAQLAADVPIANAGLDQTVTATSANGATVQLSGSVTGSTKTPFTYTWSGDFGTASGPNPIVSLSVGTHNITLTVTDAANASDTDTVVITVLPNPAPVITSPTSASVTYGVAFSYTITASNSPTSFGATGLPAGLTLTGAVISGTPTATGSFVVPLSAQNSGGTGKGSLTLTITKANASVVVSPYNVPYDGQPHSASVTSITGVNGETGAAVGVVTLNTTHTNAGTYSSDTWSFTGSANYTDIATMTITDTITKANATVVVSKYTVEYDGQPHSATVTSITGVNGETGAAVGSVTLNTTHTNVGIYSDSWSFTGGTNYNNIAATTITDTIKDTTPPVITSVTPSQATLWPPNHQMVAITVNAVASDLVGVTSLKILSVTSSEPDNGLGDGDTAGDIVITGSLSVTLRAERSGTGNGRTYTITVEAKDAAGNASTKTVTVSVPKSQGGK